MPKKKKKKRSVCGVRGSQGEVSNGVNGEGKRDMEEHTREINGTVVISVNLVDHVCQLALRGVLAQTSHHNTQFCGGDLSYKTKC